MDRNEPLIVGTIKTNFGHSEAASGVAGVIKAALSLQNNLIPQHLHFKSLNLNIPPLEGRVVIPSKAPLPISGNCNAGTEPFVCFNC
jgi:acyl transferase domain-containing protein